RLCRADAERRPKKRASKSREVHARESAPEGLGRTECEALRAKGERLKAVKPNLLTPVSAEEVNPVHEADPVAAGAPDDGVRARAVGVVAHTPQQVTVRGPRRGDDCLPGRELLGREDVRAVVDSLLARLLDLPAGRRPQLGLQLAAEAAQR